MSWRHRYLAQVRKYRREGRTIVYTDKSWGNVGHTVGREWQDKTIQTPRDAYRAGLTCRLKTSSDHRPRFAIVHAGGEHGFVPNAKLVFQCKKNMLDAHDEMDGDCYEKYFKEQLIPNLPPRSVVVMNIAAYRSRKK